MNVMGRRYHGRPAEEYLRAGEWVSLFALIGGSGVHVGRGVLSPPEDGTKGIRRTFNGLRLPEGEARDIIMVEGFIPSAYLQATDDGPGNIVPFPYKKCLYEYLPENLNDLQTGSLYVWDYRALRLLDGEEMGNFIGEYTTEMREVQRLLGHDIPPVLDPPDRDPPDEVDVDVPIDAVSGPNKY